MRKLAFALLATVAVVSQARGQQAGTVELSAFPNISYFDNSLRLGQAKAGPGARLGIFFTDHFAVEGEGAWVPTHGPNDSNVSYVPLRAKLAYNIKAGEHVGVIFAGGYVHTLYRRDRHVADNGVTGSFGVRAGLGEVTSIRIDAYVDYIPSPKNTFDNNLNWGLQPGLSFFFGGRGGGQGPGQGWGWCPR